MMCRGVGLIIGSMLLASAAAANHTEVLPTADKVYIQASGSALYLHASGGSRPGNHATLHACPKKKNHPNCQWILEPSWTRPGAYYIRVSDTDLYLHSSGGSSSGAHQTLHPCPKERDHPNCQWLIEPSTTRVHTFTIRSVDRDLFLHSSGGSSAHAHQTLHRCPKQQDIPNCQWQIERTPINGRTVEYVVFQTPDPPPSRPGRPVPPAYRGIFAQIEDRTWIRFRPPNRFLRFIESHRDDWSVYLASTHGGASVQLDLHRRSVRGIIRGRIVKATTLPPSSAVTGFGRLAGQNCSRDADCAAGLECRSLPGLNQALIEAAGAGGPSAARSVPESFCTFRDHDAIAEAIDRADGGSLAGAVSSGSSSQTQFQIRAQTLGSAITVGVGFGVAVTGLSGTDEWGIVVGSDGAVGAYSTACRAAVTEVAAVSVYGTAGVYESWDSVCGVSQVVLEGASVPLIEIGWGASQVLVDGEPIGTQMVLGLGAGVSPVTLGIGECYTSVIRLDRPAPPCITRPPTIKRLDCSKFEGYALAACRRAAGGDPATGSRGEACRCGAVWQNCLPCR